MTDLTPPALNDASPFADMRGHHVAVRTPDFEIAKRWYVASLDFRVVAEWDYADQRLGYLASPIADPFGNLIELAEVLASSPPHSVPTNS